MTSILSSIDSNQLATTQELSKFSFEIPQNPNRIRSCYAKTALISTNGVSFTLDEFIQYLIQSNTENVSKILSLSSEYNHLDNGKGIMWTVSVLQQRDGKGAGETGAGLYRIIQMARLTFTSDHKIETQSNTLVKSKV